MTQGLAAEVARVMELATDPDRGLFDATCNIYAQDGAFSVGAPSYNYSVLVLTAACMKATPSAIKIAGSEVKSLEEIQTTQPWHTLLESYYSVLDGQTQYQAQITDADNNTIAYDVLAVEHDSMLVMTRLALRLVTL